jgi:L-gulonolactone oxidase
VDSRDPELLRAARVSLGALGVVTAVTLRCVKAFTLHAVNAPMGREDALSRLDALAEAHDHFEFFAFPYASRVITRANDRTDLPVKPRSNLRAWMDDILVQNRLFEGVCLLGRAVPSLIPALDRISTAATGRSERVDRSDRIFATPRHVRFEEMEYSVPRAEAARVIRQVLGWIERERHPVSFPIEVRFSAEDDAFLSPAFDRESCWVAVHAFRGMAYEPYFRAVEAIMDAHGGRPHWGKRHFQTASTLAPRYPAWERFARVRARLDPHGRFATEAMESLLGPVEAAEEARAT